MYDYLVVGAGLFGAAVAQQLNEKGNNVLVIDRRSHIAGNAYTENIYGINVHKYGPHIFHTNDKEVWEYVNRFAAFNNFVYAPIANCKNKIYSLPFNMFTFNAIWSDAITPYDAQIKIAEQSEACGFETAGNLEERAISSVGKDIYNKLIKGYTEKQWGRKCRDLPASVIERIPVRFTYDTSYFNAMYQGIPVGGYTAMAANMLKGIEVRLNVDFLKNPDYYKSLAEKIVYSGAIDEYFSYKYGPLEYRSIKLENEALEINNFQGNAVVNYTSGDVPWTRITEHKWFEFGLDKNGREIPGTIISREYPLEWKPGMEAYYPINDDKNNRLYEKYNSLALHEKNVLFGGRLAEYKYYNMDQVINRALKLSNELLKKQN